MLSSVRPGYWAVAENGIYFVDFDDTNSFSYYPAIALWSALLASPQPIKFYDFRTHKITQKGTIEKAVLRRVPGFSVTRDGRYIAWSQLDQRESDLMMVENFR